MNRVLLFWSTVLTLAVYFLPGGGPAGAQELTKFNGSPLKFVPVHPKVEEQTTKEANLYKHRSYWFLQRAEPITPDRIKELKALQILPAFFLDQKIILVSAPKNLSFQVLKNFGWAGISPLSPQLKISPDLKSAAASGLQSIDVQILAIPGANSDAIRQNWQESWGKCQEVWSGYLSRFHVKANPYQISELAKAAWTFQIEPYEGDPIPFNQPSAENGRTNTLHQAGQEWTSGLTGQGITVAIGDGGMVENHVDFETRQTNAVGTRIGSFYDHQDHVTGTIAGAGFLRADRKGMAPQCRVLNLQTSAVISVGGTLFNNHGVTLTNNSYGVNLNCSRAGRYNATSAFLDQQSHQFPQLLHVVAAGNLGYTTCSPFPGGYQNISEGIPAAKNSLTVGAVLPLDEASWFSSKGPVQDGRLKPELVVNGNDVYSTVPNDQYGIKSGTSMATPAVTGTLALLSESFKNLHNGENPEAALLKALVCNSTDDLGLPGPDFAFGYGRLNARRARQILEQGQYQYGILSPQSQTLITLQAPAGARGVRVMLAWNDPAAPANSGKALMHDLDLHVKSGQITYLPWVCNSEPAGVKLPALRSRDSLNTLEQVTFPLLGGETLQIQVRSGILIEENQKFWLVYDWEMPDFSMVSPLPNQFLPTGTELVFRWDHRHTSLPGLVLEESTDSLQWQTVKNIPSAQTGWVKYVPQGTGFRKAWYRLRSGSQSTKACPVWLSPALNLSVEPCHQSLKLSWPGLSGATRYEIFRLQPNSSSGPAGQRWVHQGFTTQNQFILQGLQVGSRQVVSVKPWFGNNPGMLSEGKLAYPNEGICPWNNDFALSKCLQPVSGRLNTSSAPQGTLEIEIRNVGQNNAFGTAAQLMVRKPDGSIHAQNLVLNIPSGQAQNIPVNLPLNLTLAGEVALDFWLSSTQDLLTGNDTLQTKIRILANPPMSLPWSEDFESISDQSHVENVLGLTGSDRFDFTSSQKARLSTTASSLPQEFGNRALILDKGILNNTMGSGEIRLTLNLSAYAQVSNLFLDFDWMALGSLPPGNALWVRPNDQAEWIKAVAFDEGSVTAGQVNQVRKRDLRALLGPAPLGTSVQLRFVHTGNRNKDFLPAGGYSIDNLVLSLPPSDIQVLELLGPVSDCYSTTDQRYVKIKVRNFASEPRNQVQLGYRLENEPPVTEILPFLAAGDSLEYTFSEPLPGNRLGALRFSLWASGENDLLPADDTLHHQEVFLYPIIQSFPYLESFENSAGFWHSYGTGSSWAWGKPAKNLQALDTAANGEKLWKTNLSGNYNNLEQSFLQSPCFNLETLGDMQFSFNSIFKTENEYDHFWLEVSEDGKTWWKLGQLQSGTNWYNHALPSWSGSKDFWHVASHRLFAESIADKSRIRVRFAFTSDLSLNNEGIGIDDVHLAQTYEIGTDTSFSQTMELEDGKEWISFGNWPNRLLMVENTGNMGALSMNIKLNDGPIRMENQLPYLDRNFLIRPTQQPDGPVTVRLFVTDQEVLRLKEFDAGLESFQQLGIFKYSGNHQDLVLENNVYNQPEAATFIPPGLVKKVPTSGGYFLEFQVESFSEFYVSSRSLLENETTLPVRILSFSAESGKEGRPVKLEWKTASETHLDRFELEVSCDGVHFENIGQTKAKGQNGGGATYQYEYLPQICPNAPEWLFRLRSYDLGSSLPDQERLARCKNNSTKTDLPWFENPVADQTLRIRNLGKEPWSIHLTDAPGRTVAVFQGEGESFESHLSLPPGIYILHYHQNALSHTYKIQLK